MCWVVNKSLFANLLNVKWRKNERTGTAMPWNREIDVDFIGSVWCKIFCKKSKGLGIPISNFIPLHLPIPFPSLGVQTARHPEFRGLAPKPLISVFSGWLTRDHSIFLCTSWMLFQIRTPMWWIVRSPTRTTEDCTTNALRTLLKCSPAVVVVLMLLLLFVKLAHQVW